MRLIGAASIVFALALSFAISQPTIAQPPDGRTIFRFDTFGDEQLWTSFLRMNEALQSVNPELALKVGLKVDVEALPSAVLAALKADLVDLTSPAVTLQLLQLDAVVGVIGNVSDTGELTSIGITCALCHSTVDNSFAPGIGRRLDGWPNLDLDVGTIVGLSPSPELSEELRGELAEWGPGKYDPRHHVFNGTDLITVFSPSIPVVIPPAYGLRGVGFETYTGDGPISYWNTYVGVTQMGGHGSFTDPRLNIPTILQTPDLVAPKLAALLDYQLQLRSPKPPNGSFDHQAANRGRQLFRDEARCATCHPQPTFTDVLSSSDKTVPVLHDPSEIGTDPLYAARSATGRYRATPLRGLWQHPPYFHDGSAADLLAVVNHYNQHFGLNLTEAQKADLVEYLKSL